MTVEKLIDELIEREGGYVDHPADRGGPTNHGITEQVARAFGWKGPMRELPLAIAFDIYKRRYWLEPRFDDVAAIFPAVAEELFDTGVNMGPGVAVQFLQRALNALNRGASDWPDIAIDGRIGPITLQALRRFKAIRSVTGEAVLLKALEALQGERYINLCESRPANEAFLYGWLDKRIGQR